MRKTTLAALALGAIVAAGCGAGDPDTGTVNEGGAATGATKAAEAKQDAPKIAQLGKDSVTLDGGIVVSVSKPTKYTPSGSAAGHQPGNTALLVSVTIQNNGTDPLDLALASVDAAFGAEGIQAEAVYDTAKGVTGFEGTLSKGQKRTAKYVFSAPTKDTSKVAVNVRPGFLNNDVATFEGKL